MFLGLLPSHTPISVSEKKEVQSEKGRWWKPAAQLLPLLGGSLDWGIVS